MKSKKLLTGAAAAILVFSMEAVSVFAAEPVTGRNFTDSDNDGVCDYCTSDCQFIDEDGDGICDNYAAGVACGQGYVDEDGDGICDNYAAGVACRNGGRRGFRQGGRGRCCRR